MSSSPRPLVCQLAATVFAAALSLSAAHAQTATATTDPVGFITLTVNGNAGSGTALSFKSLGLTRAVEYQGNAEQILGNTLKDTDANWLDQQFNPTGTDSYYLEITGPTNAAGIGTTYDIASTDGANQTITIAAGQSFSAGITTGATFRIRKHWTIAAAFGAANEGGLTAKTSDATKPEDVIRIYDAQGSFTGYYYSNITGDVGWRRVNGTGNQANVVIYPEDGLVIAKSNGTAANVVVMGTVKTGASSLPVVGGLNVVANPYAAPMTLESSKLYTGNASTGVKAGGASNADRVSIYNGTGYDTYFYSTGGFAGVGWRKAGGGNAEMKDVQIPAGASIIIERAGSTGFNWVPPQHPDPASL